MKKFLIRFVVVLFVAALGFAGGFSYSNFKDLKSKEADVKKEVKYENKNTNKINKDKASNNENQKQVDNHSAETTQQDNNQTEINNNDYANQLKKAFNVDDNEAQSLANEINKADIDKDGVVTTKEMTPALQKFAEEGKFQPAGGGASSEDVNTSEYNEEDEQPKYTAEDAKHMTDEEFLEAYKEGMPEDEAAAVDEKAAGSDDYIGFLRGQVEADANGYGGTY